MPYCKTEGYVLKKVDYSNTSQIVTFYTRDYGKVHVIARGARRVTKQSADALDLFVRYEIVFLERASRSLNTLTEWVARPGPRSLAARLDRMYAAAYATELIHEMSEDSDPHPELFDAFGEVLSVLADSSDTEVIMIAFELNVLRSAGYAPALTQCASCGASIDRQARMRLSPQDGGTLCPACRPSGAVATWLSKGAVATMRHLGRSAVAKAARVRVSAKARREIRSALHAYVAFILGKELKLWRYV